MEIGVDIVRIKRMEGINQDSFMAKYFTRPEQEYIATKTKKEETMAGLYAAKEAFLKAVKIGIGKGLKLNEINITHDISGAPNIEITPQINYYLVSVGGSAVSLSISHDGEYAIAFCVIY